VKDTVPFDAWKFRKCEPEILVEWIALCLAADRKDGKGLQLENIRPKFSSFSSVSRKNCQRLTKVCSPFEKIIRFSSLDVEGLFRVREKAFDLNFSTFFTQECTNPHDRVRFNRLHNDLASLQWVSKRV